MNLVTLGVRVTGGRGQHIPGLDKSSFTVLEDGKPQPIAVFEAEKQPISLGILLDTSRSMFTAGKLASAQAAIRELIAAGHPENQIFYMEFGDKPGELTELSRDRLALPRPALNAAASRSGTAFYDAIAVALCRIRTARYARHALLVISDGADQHSRLRIEALTQVVQSSDTQVYIVGYFSAEENALFEQRQPSVTLVSGRSIDNPVLVFERLARESGAESFFPATPAQLKRAMEAIRKEVDAQYTLGYYPETAAKSNHRIEVKVARNDVSVRVRRAFSALDTAVHFATDTCAIDPEEHPYPWESRMAREDGRLVYREDFTDPRTGWPFGASFWYGTSGYHINQKGRPQATGESTIAAYGPWWNDVRASVSLKEMPAPSRDVQGIVAAAGLVFRLNDRGFYALLISSPSGKRQVYAKLIAKEFRAAQSRDLIPWILVVEPDQDASRDWKTISVECRGAAIIPSVSSKIIGRVRDSSFSSGHIGMVQFGAGHAVFSDLLAGEIK